MFLFHGVESEFLSFVIRGLDLFSPLFIVCGTSVVEGNAIVGFDQFIIEILIFPFFI